MAQEKKQEASNEEAPDIGISPEKVCYVIVKARVFDVKEGLSDSESGSNAADDGMRDILEDLTDDADYQELMEFIRNLDEDEQIALVALSWVGRGTYSPDEWQDALAQARDAHNERTAEYLVGMPLLGDYLEEGLSAFGMGCEDVELRHL